MEASTKPLNDYRCLLSSFSKRDFLRRVRTQHQSIVRTILSTTEREEETGLFHSKGVLGLGCLCEYLLHACVSSCNAPCLNIEIMAQQHLEDNLYKYILHDHTVSVQSKSIEYTYTVSRMLCTATTCTCLERSGCRCSIKRSCKGPTQCRHPHPTVRS